MSDFLSSTDHGRDISQILLQCQANHSARSRNSVICQPQPVLPFQPFLRLLCVRYVRGMMSVPAVDRHLPGLTAVSGRGIELFA